MSGVRTTGTLQIMGVLQRSGAGAFTTNRTPADAWTAVLQQQTGSGSASTRSLEKEFLQGRITSLSGSAPPVNSTLPDLWDKYLSAKGHTGSIVDRWNQWLDHGTL